jgi:hypothetical protein
MNTIRVTLPFNSFPAGKAPFSIVRRKFKRPRTGKEHNVTIRGVATNGGAFWKVLA